MHGRMTTKAIDSTAESLTGRILTEDGWVDGTLSIRGQRIDGIRRDTGAKSTGRIILPGFIDLHCHGGGGADAMDGGEATRVMAQLHARHGTTALLATTMTAPKGDIERAFEGAAGAIAERHGGEARVLGIHLEGPFISPDRLGAQPPYTMTADIGWVQSLMARAPIRVATWAPEADESDTLRPFLRSAGVRVQIGHSSACYACAKAAFERGLDGATHLYNAMTPLQHRAPGIVGAVLAHARYAEIIPDLVHVDAGAIHAALRAIPNLYAITDGTAASGMPDGDYRLGRHEVKKQGDAVRLADGTLAGSCLTMDAAFRNLVNIGLSLEEASKRTATIAADYLGLADRGRLRDGAFADIVVLDESLNVIEVYVEGERIAR